jgi:hypothetical protein
MLKQSSIRITKVLAILLAVLFIVSVTVAAVSALSSTGKEKATSEKSALACPPGTNKCPDCPIKQPCCIGECQYQQYCSGRCVGMVPVYSGKVYKGKVYKGKVYSGKDKPPEPGDPDSKYVWDTQAGCGYGYRCNGWVHLKGDRATCLGSCVSTT